jgi:hypothetical protein
MKTEKDFFRQQNKGAWGDSGVQAQLGNALDRGFTRYRDLPEIHWRNQGKTGGGGIMKNKLSSQKWS